MRKIQSYFLGGLVLLFAMLFSNDSQAQAITNCVEVYSMDQTDPNSTPNN